MSNQPLSMTTFHPHHPQDGYTYVDEFGQRWRLARTGDRDQPFVITLLERDVEPPAPAVARIHAGFSGERGPDSQLLTPQCVRVELQEQCPWQAVGVVAVAFYPFPSVMRMNGADKPLRRLILALPMCAAHQATARLEDLMLESSLQPIIRMIERETTISVDPKGIKVIPVPFDDKDYQQLEAVRRQARADQQRASTGVTHMRQITHHHDGHGLNESILITADPPGPCGASHSYDLKMNPTGNFEVLAGALQFQKGPRLVEGSTPGVTEAAVLAVLIDRLEGFQAGPYACQENEQQLEHLREALRFTRERAHRRAAAGTLGTMQPDPPATPKGDIDGSGNN